MKFVYGICSDDYMFSQMYEHFDDALNYLNDLVELSVTDYKNNKEIGFVRSIKQHIEMGFDASVYKCEIYGNVKRTRRLLATFKIKKFVLN